MSGLMENLRGSSEPLKELVHLAVEDILNRPVSTLVDTAAISAGVTQAFRNSVKDPANLAWLRDQLARNLTALGEISNRGKLKSLLPAKAIKPICRLVAQEFVIQEDFAVALLDHPAFHGLVREVLTRSLLDFTKQIAGLLPGGKLVTSFLGKARSLASAGFGETSSLLEQRATEYVEEALAPALGKTARYLACDEFAHLLGDWRSHIVDTILDQPIPDMLALLKQLDPGKISDEHEAISMALASWNKLDSTIQTALEKVLERFQGQSLREFTAGTSFEKEWRHLVEQHITTTLKPFVDSDAFSGWLEKHAPS